MSSWPPDYWGHQNFINVITPLDTPLDICSVNTLSFLLWQFKSLSWDNVVLICCSAEDADGTGAFNFITESGTVNMP